MIPAWSQRAAVWIEAIVVASKLKAQAAPSDGKVDVGTKIVSSRGVDWFSDENRRIRAAASTPEKHSARRQGFHRDDGWKSKGLQLRGGIGNCIIVGVLQSHSAHRPRPGCAERRRLEEHTSELQSRLY